MTLISSGNTETIPLCRLAVVNSSILTQCDLKVMLLQLVIFALLDRLLPRCPHLYNNLKLPNKLPPRRDPLVVSSLPMLGYMEQAVASAITKALTAVGMVKPKYPFVSATKSALIYVAFHLKGTDFASHYIASNIRLVHLYLSNSICSLFHCMYHGVQTDKANAKVSFGSSLACGIPIRIRNKKPTNVWNKAKCRAT